MATNMAPAKTHTGKAFTLNCDCGFQMKNFNRNEAVEIGMMHVKMTHPDMKLGKPQIEGMIKSA